MALDHIRGVVETRLPFRVQRLDKGISALVLQGLNDEGMHLVAELQDELDRQGGNVSGDLRKSINHRATLRGQVALLSVGPGVEYGPYHELGTKPHWVPIEPLIQWVHNRGLTGRWSLKTKRRMGSRTAQAREDKRLARAIQVRISKRGTRAHPFVNPVFMRERDKVEGRMHVTFRRGLEKLNRE